MTKWSNWFLLSIELLYLLFDGKSLSSLVGLVDIMYDRSVRGGCFFFFAYGSYTNQLWLVEGESLFLPFILDDM